MPESEIMGARRGRGNKVPAEIVAKAKALKKQGLSASEIGKAIGKSRDAVLGILWRDANPPATRSQARKPKLPRDLATSMKNDVWAAWGADTDSLRRAIWARARRGARKTLEAR